MVNKSYEMSDRRRCCVQACSFAKKPIGNGVRLYGLPKNQEAAELWHKWIFIQNGRKASKNNFVCSNHFSGDVQGTRKLKTGAVPSIPAVADENIEWAEAEKTHDMEQIHENVNVHAAPIVQPTAIQPDHCEPSHSFEYSSVVEINMNQAYVDTMEAENYTRCIIPLEQPQTLCGSGNALCGQGTSASVVEGNPNIEKSSKMFFIVSNEAHLPTMEQAQVLCSGGNTEIGSIDTSYYLELLFDESPIEENNNIECEKTEGRSVPIVGGVIDYSLFISTPDNTCETANNVIIEEKNVVEERSVPIVEGVNDSSLFISTLDNTCERANNVIIGARNVVEIPQETRRTLQPTTSRKCFAKNCSNPNKKTIHTFPAIIINGELNQDNLQRCKVWIKNSGNVELLSQFSSKLHGRCGLCSDHFDDSQYCNPQTRKRLLPNAIPSMNFGIPISDADMSCYPKWGPSDVFSDLTSTSEHLENETNIEIGQQNDNPDNQPSTGPDQYQRKFEDVVNTLEWRTCNQCKEKFFTKKSSKKKCPHSKPICLSLSKENGMDPGDVPPELQNLSSIEEQLISIIHPVVQVCKVKGHQYSYKGNIINFPQDVKSFATKLPHNIHSLKSTIKVRTSKDATNYKDFHVRADVVRKALVWLQANNPYYFDIQISEENVNLLPQDGNVYEHIQEVQLEEGQDEEDENCDEDTLITESNVPVLTVPSEQEQIANVIDWPAIGKNPVDELRQSDGNVVKAFPTLFPYGVADLGHARRKKISDTTYFQHLMRYHDDRFAQHNRFRFFALNSLMRWSALTDGNIFIKRNPEFKNMSVKDLKERVEKDPSLLRKILFQGNNIRGTKAFWHARGRELEAMIQQIGLPTLFFTLSAADMHWPELYKLLAPDEEIETMTEYRRRELIQQNPLVVDEFFLTRAETFLQEVLTPKYKVKDFWFRIEYQHRGSPHLHGLLWLENAPDVSNILNATEEEKEEIINYFDNLISTMHPNINEAPATTHPCRKKLSEVDNLKQDLAQLLNKVQRHTVCTPGYCLKKGNPPTCRFNFPTPMQESTQLDFTDKSNVKLVTARNDTRLNKYNSYIISTWRGNIDVSPVLSEKALINYLAKYVSKSETRSQTLVDLMKTIISDSDQNKPARHALQRIFIRTCSERDYSAQETCHILMGLKLYSRGARNLISINFNETSQWQQVRKEGAPRAVTLLDQYKQRKGEENEMVCLWHMAKFHKVTNPQKFNIIMVYPTIKLKTSSQDNESFYKQQCLLFVPWRDEQTLQGDKSWEEVYNDYLPLIEQNRKNILTLTGEPDEDAIYDEYELDELPREQWMAISGMRSNQHTENIQLGFRQIDMDKNWHDALNKYKEIGGIPYLQSFLSNAKQDSSSTTTANQQFQFDLSPEQQKVVDLAKLQILQCQNKLASQGITTKLPTKIIVQGKAGTGKSVIVSEIVRLVESELGQGSIIVLGPTGVSAVNVNGSTIQSKLKISSRKKTNNNEEFVPLKGQAAHDFAQLFENVKFVICDEFSMIGCSMLSKIDQRLRQATGKSDEEFGGLNIYFFGDIKQLSPVADCAAYSTNQSTLQTIRGKQLYDNMDAAFILTKIHRQNDAQFLQVLNNISEGKVTRQDYNLLSTRFIGALSCQELKEFRNALHLYPTLDRVHNFNKDCLETLQNNLSKEPVPVACITAKHNVPAAANGSINDGEGLEPTLYLAEGAKIMLRVNLWTEKGLVNGAMGEIEEIIYNEDAHPSHDPPSVLICKFPSYKGPYLDPVKKTVPIIPLTKSWVNKDGINCSREQFPVTVAYATSIHKSQGLTLLKAFVDIGDKERSPGLSYVALSRVKSLSGLALEPFSFERLKNLSKSYAIQRRMAWEQLLQNKLSVI